MLTAAARRRLVLTVAAVSLALPALGQEAFAQQDSAQQKLAQRMMPPDGMAEAGPPPNLECAAEKISASGAGFSSSREASAEAAVTVWLEKAQAVYPEATWEMAKDANISCAVQGLFSKCFADGIPCKLKGGDAAASSE